MFLRTKAIARRKGAVTAALEPATRLTDASSLTKTSDYDAITLFGCLEGLKPLDTSSKVKTVLTHDLVSRELEFQQGNKPLS